MVFGYLLWIGLIIGSGLGVLGGIGWLLLGFDRFEEERAIRTTPVGSLDSLAVGPVAVRGRIEPVDHSIHSLYCCDACVAYELEVNDTGSDRSQTHVDRRHTVPFAIVTDNGSIRVEGGEFEFHVSPDRRWDQRRKSHESVDEGLRQFERNWEVPSLRSGDNRQYDASYLCPGDEVYAYGTADIDKHRNEDPGKHMVLTGRDELFFLSDHSPRELLRERRFALAKAAFFGTGLAVVSLVVFLWLTGIAQVFLGA